MTNLYLIRHGESYANVDPHGPMGGMRGDRGLTPHGRMQAERLRDRLAATGEIRPDALLSSTLPRARQTAEIVASAFELSLIFDDDLQERRPGEGDGLTPAEMHARFGRVDDRREPLRPFAPGAESWADFTLRVARTLDRIQREYEGQAVLVFTHGGVIDTSFLILFGMPTLYVPDAHFFTYNTAITHWQLGHRDGQDRWRLVRYNDDLHTRDIGTEERIRWPHGLRAPDQDRTWPAVPLPTEDSGDDENAI
jgi:2,3-bisphosphoglycerate-dependent phosphoglycerate mutase